MKKILLSSAVAVLVLTGCGEDKKETTAAVEAKTEVVKTEAPKAQEVKPEVTTVVKEAAQSVTQTVTKAATEVKDTVTDATTKVVESAKESTTATVEEVKEVASNVVNEATNTVTNAVNAATTAVSAKTEEKKEAAPSINATALYATCAGCHGANGEKAALGKSQIIQGWPKEKVIEALNGYKAGTYGGAMKGIMKGQVSTKSDAEIEALADLISKF